MLNLAAVWVGRDELLDRLHTQLISPSAPKVMALIGQGGIGKTSLAAKLVERVGVSFGREAIAPDCPFDGVFCLRVGEGTGFDAVAGKLMGALGLPDRDFVQPADKLDAIWRVLRRESWLLVLDNLEDVLHPVGHEQAGRAIDPDLGRLLNGLVYEMHSARVLLTSREVPKDLGDARSVARRINQKYVLLERVMGISVEDSIALLREYVTESSDEDLRWVAERVGGQVLVLTQLGNLIESTSVGYVRKRPELVTTEIEPVLRAQLARLSEEAWELLKRMSVLRVSVSEWGLTILRLCGSGEEQIQVPDSESVEAGIQETRSLLQRLDDCSQIEKQKDIQRAEIFYGVHPVIADFLQQEYFEERALYWQYAAGFYSSITSEKINSLDNLLVFLEALYCYWQLGMTEQVTDTVVGSFPQMLGPWGYWGILREWMERVLPHTEGDDYLTCLQNIGIICRNTGDWDNAAKYFQQSLLHAQERDEKNGIAISWGLLGDIERNRGNWDAAEQLYQQRLKVEKELGDRSGIGATWASLGSIENLRGNWDAAERLYRQSLQVEEELGDRSAMAATWASLGYIENLRGNWDAAEQLYRQSLQMREELGDRADIAISWGLLGDIERKRGNWDAAEQLYRQYQQMCEKLGDRAGMATSWGILGDIECKRGNWDAAERLYQQSQQLREELGARSGIAEITCDRGVNELGRGNLEVAENHLNFALQRFEELGDRPHIAEVHYRLMQLEIKRHNPTAAQTHYTTAHTLFTQLGAAKDREKIEQEWNALE